MKVLCITLGRYPNNDAASQRLHLIASMLSEAGHEVKVVSRNREHRSGMHGLVKYKSTYSQPKSKFDRFNDVYFIFPREVKKEIERFKPDAMLLTSAPTSLARWLCRNKERFLLFHDSVEWYSKEEYRHPMLSMEYQKKQFWMKHILPKCFHIIAISKYLQEYFEGQGNSCIRIPSVCETEQIAYNTECSGEKITISYAGSPGKKDRFREIIQALLLMNEQERDRIRLNIIGATKEQIAGNAGVSVDTLSSLDDCVSFFGRVSRDEVYQHLAKSDFTILIRPDNLRYAKAGFPTKVPESLAAGTPVICNLTSDLGLYLTDENAVIVKECTTDAVLEALRRALALDGETLSAMKLAARKTAEQHFDYRLYENMLDEFVRGDQSIGTD